MFLILVMLIGVGIHFISKELKNTKSEYYSRGYILGADSVISSQMNNGVFYYYDNSTGNMTIKYVALNQLCNMTR